jgi:hypothetical protein
MFAFSQWQVNEHEEFPVECEIPRRWAPESAADWQSIQGGISDFPARRPTDGSAAPSPKEHHDSSLRLRRRLPTAWTPFSSVGKRPTTNAASANLLSADEAILWIFA